MFDPQKILAIMIIFAVVSSRSDTLSHVSLGPEEDEYLGASCPRQNPKENAQRNSLEMVKALSVFEHVEMY